MHNFDHENFIFFLDIIFLQGTEVIFKVALSLLSSQETLIMECENFESIVEFLKSSLPDMNTTEMEKIITQVWFK